MLKTICTTPQRGAFFIFAEYSSTNVCHGNFLILFCVTYQLIHYHSHHLEILLMALFFVIL